MCPTIYSLIIILNASSNIPYNSKVWPFREFMFEGSSYMENIISTIWRYTKGISHFGAANMRRILDLSKTYRHSKTHIGERPIHCSYCNKVLSNISDLFSYLRIYSEEIQFQCRHCEKKVFFREFVIILCNVRIHKLT